MIGYFCKGLYFAHARIPFFLPTFVAGNNSQQALALQGYKKILLSAAGLFPGLNSIEIYFSYIQRWANVKNISRQVKKVAVAIWPVMIDPVQGAVFAFWKIIKGVIKYSAQPKATGLAGRQTTTLSEII